MITFSVNQLIAFRDYLVVDVDKETPDSIAAVLTNLFRGIGYLILGNMYDNVRVPKKLTTYLLVSMAILTALTAIVPEDVARNQTKKRDERWDQLITQLSSIRLFEGGVQMACLIILHNWFPLHLSPFVVSLWQTCYLIIPTI